MTTRGHDETILCIDVGTTAAKAIVIDRAGRIVARAESSYPPATGDSHAPHHTTSEYFIEQHPEQWWQAIGVAARTCEPRRHSIAAVAFTGQMQDVIIMDDEGPIRPAILYSDQRAQAEAEMIADQIGLDHWIKRTGNLQDGSSPFAKLLWVRQHEEDNWARTRTVLLGAHDYATWRACGKKVTDPTNASTTGLFDLAQRQWATDLLQALSMDADLLPQIVSPQEIVGTINPDAAAHLGVDPGTPVFHGCGDAGATTVGAGAGEPGRRYAYVGTSGWIAASVDSGRADPDSGLFTLAHPKPGRLIVVGPMLTAGGNFDWARQTLFPGLSFEEIESLARQAAPGSGGVTYLPFLSGERSPFRDGAIRAGFNGIHQHTTRAELARAVYEGVAFGLRSIAEAIDRVQQHLPSTNELFTAGGGMRSRLLSEIVAHVLQCTVSNVDTPEDVTCRGAAILAGIGLGWYETYDPGAAYFGVRAKVTPDPDVSDLYDRAFETYLKRTQSMRSGQKGV